MEHPLMTSPTRLFLIRHAEVEARYQRVFGGRIDMDLSPHGHEQARACAAWLQSISFDAVYASPMRRVQQTLAPIQERRRGPVILTELREVDFGDWTGHTWDEVKDKFGVSAFDWLELLHCGGIPNAEDAGQFRERVDLALRQILREHGGKTVAVVCHGGVIRMALSLLLGLPLPKLAHFEIDYASVTEVEHHPRKTAVQSLNLTPWRHFS